MNIVLLGAPGAGKGTQAKILSDKLSLPIISTGNIIRDALKSGSELGEKAKSFVDAGRLLPDNIVIDIVKERLDQPDCENGFILDGFPRTIPQAEALDMLDITIDRVIDIEVDDEEIISRMSGRRICEKCGNSYHLIYNKPNVDGVCNTCAGALIQRKDDHPDTVKERLRVYHNETEPLKLYYKKQDKLIIIEGHGDIQEISKKVISALEV